MDLARRGSPCRVVVGIHAGMVVGLLHHSPPLPDLHLATLEEQPISLMSYQGRPTVVNLWAT